LYTYSTNQLAITVLHTYSTNQRAITVNSKAYVQIGTWQQNKLVGVNWLNSEKRVKQWQWWQQWR